MSLERSDISTFLQFWDIEPQLSKDKYYMLAHTQGWLPTDNFEFLAEFYPTKNLKFVTDVAGLSQNKIEKGKIKIDDILDAYKQPRNVYDNKAVLLKKDGFHIGYIKKIHNRVFYHQKSSFLQVRVKALEENGQIRRIFVEVFN